MAMTSVRMPDELMQKLEQTAEKLRRSKGWVINDAVQNYVEQTEKQARMLKETQEALADVKAGRTIDGDTVTEWLGGVLNYLSQHDSEAFFVLTRRGEAQ